MDKTYFIDLTNKLYRLTLFFPQKEPLRNKIRETADETLADLVLILEGEKYEKRESAFKVERNLEILDVLLELSKKQNWIEEPEIRRIQENYWSIKREVEEFNEMSRRQMLRRGIGREMAALAEADAQEEAKTPFKKEEKERNAPQENPQTKAFSKKPRQEEVKLNKRQQKMVNLLNRKEKMQVRDFQGALPDATKRTLRRDLSDMMEKKLVKRTGKGNTTYYSRA